MIKIFRIWSVLMVLTITISCSNEMSNTIDNSLLVNENDHKDVNHLTSDFSLALAKVLAENRDMRELIKVEALKQFDHDYDVLYMLIKDRKTKNGETLEELLLTHMNKENLAYLIQKIPTLTIFVPSLPEESFSAEAWNIDQEMSYVAYKNENEAISYVGSDEIVNTFACDQIPLFPIVVVKPSERVILQNSSTRSLNSSTVLQAENGMNFVFEFDEFNNVAPAKAQTRASATDIPDILKKAYDAKKFSDMNSIWQRDYIYYNISTKDGIGVFQRSISECIYSFELMGDPNNVFNIIADQDGDPKYKETEERGDRGDRGNNNLASVDSKFWYDGNFEFIMKIYVSNKQLTVNEIIKVMSINPEELFELSIQRDERKPGRVTGIRRFKKYYLPEPFPLFDWNIENYSTSIKISIEEQDNQETAMQTLKTSSTFATNFEFNAGFGEAVKIGGKMGASSTTTHEVSTTLTTYLNSDQLGDVIINFGDDVVVNNEMDSVGFKTIYTSTGSTSSSGRRETSSQNVAIYKPALNPKYKSGYYKIEILPLAQY